MCHEWLGRVESDKGVGFGTGQSNGNGSKRLVLPVVEGQKVRAQEMLQELRCPG